MDSARQEVLSFYSDQGADVIDLSDDQDTTDLGKWSGVPAAALQRAAATSHDHCRARCVGFEKLGQTCKSLNIASMPASGPIDFVSFASPMLAMSLVAAAIGISSRTSCYLANSSVCNSSYDIKTSCGHVVVSRVACHDLLRQIASHIDTGTLQFDTKKSFAKASKAATGDCCLGVNLQVQWVVALTM